LTRADLGNDAIAAIVERISTAVAEPMVLSGHTVRATCSIGVSRYPEDGVEASDLLKRADAAMYRSKRTTLASGYRRVG
jgi:diguanylate cyclase (GGDEF)-like protein